MMPEWDNTWNCQSGRLLNIEDVYLPWEDMEAPDPDDDFAINE